VTPILIYGSLYAAGIILGGWITPQPVVFLGCAAVALALVTGLAAWCSRLRVASWLAVPLALATGAVTYAAAMAPGEWDPTHLPDADRAPRLGREGGGRDTAAQRGCRR
jgi:hypothetical protein